MNKITSRILTAKDPPVPERKSKSNMERIGRHYPLVYDYMYSWKHGDRKVKQEGQPRIEELPGFSEQTRGGTEAIEKMARV